MWDLVQELGNLQLAMDRVFGLSGLPSGRVAFLPGHGARRYPLINLHEDRDNVYLEALMPGADPQTLDVAVVENTLTIAGEKTGLPVGHRPVDEEAYHRNERAAGRFVRTVPLPVQVDTAAIKADYQQGVLWLTLPKTEAAKPRRIDVRVAA